MLRRSLLVCENKTVTVPRGTVCVRGARIQYRTGYLYRIPYTPGWYSTTHDPMRKGKGNRSYRSPRAPITQRCGPVGAALVLETIRGAKLYLSGEAFASNYTALQQAGITAVVACGCPCHFEDTFTYLEVRLRDAAEAKVGRFLDSAANFIHTHLARGNGVLCHCKAGICRSTTMVMAYLIKHRGFGVDEALACVRKARSCARPRPEFIEALHCFAQSMEWKGDANDEAATTNAESSTTGTASGNTDVSATCTPSASSMPERLLRDDAPTGGTPIALSPPHSPLSTGCSCDCHAAFHTVRQLHTTAEEWKSSIWEKKTGKGITLSARRKQKAAGIKTRRTNRDLKIATLALEER